MENVKYKPKRFLIPILSLVIISIICIATISAYITTSMYKKHMNSEIEQTKKEYTQKHKNRIYNDVNYVNETIKFEITKIENILKEDLKEKVLIAYNVAQYTYNTYKNKLNKKQIKKKIADALSVITFYDNRGYYFMYDNKTKVLFGHPMKKFIGKDMTNFRDARGLSLMELDTQALKKDRIGFKKNYFIKPDNQNKEFPKITSVIKFEPLDIVLGIGEYLDVIEKRVKQNILDRFSGINYDKNEQYFFILDVHNFKGGDTFATILINSNRPELEGKKISSELKDVKGNKYIKNTLNITKDKGEGYTEYWYKKPSTQQPAPKMSYIYLQKDWNWIIGSGFYYDNLEKQIAIMKNSIITHTNNTINKTLLWVFALSLIAIIISIFVSIKIDKTINLYANKIIEYESNKRKQDNILMQQSKLASMGEMIANIAHQWRQPLAMISMDANNIMLDTELNIIDKENLEKYAQDIGTQTNYLSKTIDDFRNFIKGDREKKIFNLKNEIHNCIQLVDGLIKKNSINLILDLRDDIKIKGYKNELTQCLINILNNAKDVLVEKTVDKKFIFISTYLEDDKAIIKIKDNAGGIPKEVLPKIYEPYFTTKHKSQGTGLGLHMTYYLIVEGMQGTIEATNVSYTYKQKLYKGAEFTISLPSS